MLDFGNIAWLAVLHGVRSTSIRRIGHSQSAACSRCSHPAVLHHDLTLFNHSFPAMPIRHVLPNKNRGKVATRHMMPMPICLWVLLALHATSQENVCVSDRSHGHFRTKVVFFAALQGASSGSCGQRLGDYLRCDHQCQWQLACRQQQGVCWLRPATGLRSGTRDSETCSQIPAAPGQRRAFCFKDKVIASSAQESVTRYELRASFVLHRPSKDHALNHQ